MLSPKFTGLTSRCAISLMLATFSISCRKRQDYPGFTQVGEDRSTSYFVDASTIKREAPGRRFSFIELIENSAAEYDIGAAEVDCDTRESLAGEAGHYDMQKRFISATPEHVQSVAAITQFVCAQGESRPLFTGAFNSDEAISVALGGTATEWTPTHPKDSKMSILESFAGNKFKVSVLLNAAYTEGGNQKRVLVLGSLPTNTDYTCHACRVLLSAFTFRLDAHGWFMEAYEPFLGEGGSFGTAPTISLVKLGSDRSGFSTSSSYMAQGEESAGIELYAPWGPRIVRAIMLQTLFDDTGAMGGNPNAKYQLDYTFGPSQTNGFFDLHLTTVGNKLDDTGNLISANKVQTCKITGTAYVCVPQ
jgi:hypothetical protein